MDSTPLLMTGFMLAALSVPSSAELKPLDDRSLDQVVGQDGISINIVTEIRASEIRYAQHNADGSERGSVALKKFNLFTTRAGANSLTIQEAFDAGFADTNDIRGAVILGIDSDAVRLGLEFLSGVSNVSVPSLVDPLRNGETLVTDTITFDVTSGSTSRGGSGVRILLPQITSFRESIEPFLDEVRASPANALFSDTIDNVQDLISSIPVLAEFELGINDLSVGTFRINSIIDLDTQLNISGRTGGESGLIVDGLLGIGFGEVSYLDTDDNGGSVSFSGVRFGQVDSRGEPQVLVQDIGPDFLARNAFGAPFLGLTLDAETRELVDLTTGLSREATVLRLGLPDIQNLDLTVDNIRIGEGNLGGFEILDINTLVDNNRVLELNQRFGYNIAPGTGTGVDALGQAANGYQLSGELLLSGTADNSLQFNGQWGGQIGSIRYYDSLRGEEGQLALNDISVFNTAQDEQGNTLLTPAEFQGTLTLTPQGVEFGNLNAQGSIAIQSVTVGQTNLGAFLIDNFQLRNSHITISGK